eukprot:180704_1
MATTLTVNRCSSNIKTSNRNRIEAEIPTHMATLKLIALIACITRRLIGSTMCLIFILCSRFEPNSALVITTSIYSNCALENSKIKCWGRNGYCVLGTGDSEDRGDDPNDMGDSLLLIDLGSNFIPTQIATGTGWSCVISTTNTVKCFGDGTYGKLGIGNTNDIGCSSSQMGNNLLETDLGSGFMATQIMGGRYHACALSTANAVKCFGRNTFGQLGLGDTSDRGDGANEMGDKLPEIDFGTNFVPTAIMVRGEVSCAISAENKVKCFGRNDLGQLGQGDTEHRGDGANEMGDNLPEIDFGTDFIPMQMTGGRNHICALSTTNTVKCFGENNYGQLGYGNTNSRADPSNVPEIDFGSNFVPAQISSKRYHTCALSTTKGVKCFGRNDVGQLGQGDTTHRGDNANEMGDNLPTIDLGTDFTPMQVIVGGYHTCTISTTKQIKCFGENNYGTLGLGDTVVRGNKANQMGDNLPTIDLGASFISTGPTGSPTRYPSNNPTTKQPSQSPTMHPTKHPTSNPTSSPTVFPSNVPTVTPSRAPTPKPTDPSLLTCGQQAIGDYNDQILEFHVRLPYAGDLTFDASSSNIEIQSLTAVFGMTPVGSDTDNDGILTLPDAIAADYLFALRAPNGVYGTFDVSISCQSNQPTLAPTLRPSQLPTDAPIQPTRRPTDAPITPGSPTKSPTPATPLPTQSPSLHPMRMREDTVSPSVSPTQLPPSTIDIISCDDEVSGPYNTPISIQVQMPYHGDLQFDASQSFPLTITSLSVVFGTTPIGFDTNNDGILMLQDIVAG